MHRASTATAPKSPPEPRSSVFVVDDDGMVRRLLVSILESGGHGVRAFSGGAEALRALEHGPPDALVLDVMMPGVNGNDVLARLPKVAPDVSVVVVSAVVGVDAIAEAIRLGASEYLTKPVRRERLLGAVRQAVEWTRLKRRISDLESKLCQVEEAATRAVSARAATPRDPYTGERKSPSLLDLQTLERQAIRRALEYTGGNVSEAARRLGIGRTTLYRKMAAFGLVTPA